MYVWPKVSTRKVVLERPAAEREETIEAIWGSLIRPAAATMPKPRPLESAARKQVRSWRRVVINGTRPVYVGQAGGSSL